MKFILFVLLALELFAFDTATASKIFDKIFLAMVDKDNISVYTVNNKYKEVVLASSNLYISSEVESADIILVDSLEEIPKNSEGLLLFTTSHVVYKVNKDSVGAFYWDRGHIKIEFSRVRLHNKQISLPQNFDKYIKDSE
ncbi:hypothetical protein HUE87_05815 [Candidatus Sulfurimonas marisnigri]|uniref:Uncharacterized protein n=1 Tax=Candidatus Sulfurimonas marisnigri TaxID=2740405 RepID=A0A7S7RRM6_9BACT|nr:hypothetical protein [Candidatus Sulfurimonas marisnigri]QOY55740.1 hypothetical protein HUE87_05815 [Candidatus Sulfurimonas marisnigri]